MKQTWVSNPTKAQVFRDQTDRFSLHFDVRTVCTRSYATLQVNVAQHITVQYSTVQSCMPYSEVFQTLAPFAR